MGGKSQPDYSGAAIAQGEANRDVVRDQTFANRPTQYTPWGYTQWTPEQVIDPATGEATTGWTQTTGLTPELQDILNKQIAIQSGRSDVAGNLTGRMMDEFGQPMDWGELQPMGDVPLNQYTMAEPLQRSLDYSGVSEIADPYETRQAAEDAVYNQAMSRIQPAQEAATAALDLRLRNQGLSPNDAAYQAQMSGLMQQQTDQTNQALWSANQAGREEAGQMFGQQLSRRQQGVGEQNTQGQFFNQAAQTAFGQALGANAQNYGQQLQSANYANQLRQQQMAEAMQQRGFSLNEINALLSGQQVGMPQMPNFSNATAAQAAPIYQGAVDQGNYQAATSPWNALAGIGGAALGGWASTGFEL